jgi:uncharacterized lipoprotein
MSSLKKNRHLPVLVVASIVSVLLLLLAGCGGSSEAQQHVKKGEDRLLAKSASMTEQEAQANSQKVFTAISEAAQTGQPISQETVSLAKQLSAELDKAKAGFVGAKAEFEKALQSSDVGKYKNYAELQLQGADLTLKYMLLMQSVLDDAASQLPSSGFDQQAWQARLQEFLSTLQASSQQTTDIENKIQDAKKKL